MAVTAAEALAVVEEVISGGNYSVAPMAEEDFMFVPTHKEFANLRTQFASSSWGGVRLDYNVIIRFLFCLLLPLVGCTNQQKETPKWSEDTYMVSCDSVSVYPYLLQSTFFLKEGSLVMIDPMNVGKICILDLQTNQMTHYSMTDSLKGINPALFPFSIYHSGRYYYYRMEDGRLKITGQSLRFRGETATKAVQLNKNNYVTLGYFRRLLGLYNKKSEELEFYGHYPLSVQIPFDGIAKSRITQSFQGEIAYSEQHSKIVYCSYRFAYMSCYKFTGRKLKFEWEHHLIPPPEVSIVDGLLKRDAISPHGGFSDVVMAGDYIFASYWQSNLTDSNSGVKNNILVYSMKGDHIATYNIDHQLYVIAVDLEEKTIYGILHKDDTVGFAPFIPVIVRLRFDNHTI